MLPKIVLTFGKLGNSRPSASNFQSFSRSLEHFFLTVGQNNFGKKIPFLLPLLPRRGKLFFLFKQDYWFCQGQKLRDFGDAKLMLPKKILTLVKVSYYLFLQLSMKKDQRGLKDSFKIVFFFHYHLIQRIVHI